MRTSRKLVIILLITILLQIVFSLPLLSDYKSIMTGIWIIEIILISVVVLRRIVSWYQKEVEYELKRTNFDSDQFKAYLTGKQKSDDRPCCRQTARLQERYCPCGRVISDEMLKRYQQS